MENASYALQIAAGTMIAVLVIALIVYVFTALSGYQEEQDLIAERESITEFNESFEVYDKSIMYGTDVLSCLNKAEDNNQKYVYSIYYGQDSSEVIYEAREDYIINVSVYIEDDLAESISVTGQDEKGNSVQLTQSQWQDCYDNDIKLFSTDSSDTSKFTINTITYYYFTTLTSRDTKVNKINKTYTTLVYGNDNLLNTKLSGLKSSYTTIIEGHKTYELVSEGDNDVGQLLALLSTVTETEQTIYNDDFDTTKEEALENGQCCWKSITWTTAVNDFKTRKFTCTGIEYNDAGYVSFISFKEVSS